MISLFFACATEPIPPQKYTDLLLDSQCKTNDQECRVQECYDFFSTSHPVENEIERDAVATLCTNLDKENTPIHQACGIPACYMLPQIHPTQTISILQDGIARTAAQRLARQTLIRGVIDNNLLPTFLSTAKSPDAWLTVVVSETLCESGSAAKQMGLTCEDAYPKASQAAWELAQKQIPSSTEYGSALNLAMILDAKRTAPLLLSLALDTKMDAKKRSAAAQALHFASFRGYQLSPDFQPMLRERCLQGDPALILLCRAQNK